MLKKLVSDEENLQEQPSDKSDECNLKKNNFHRINK